MKNTVITILTFFNINFIALANTVSDTMDFKGGISIIKKKFFYEIFIYGKIRFTDNYIFFSPKYNKQYVNNLKIPIDSIEQILNKPFSVFWIEMKNGCKYKIALRGKRKLLNKMRNLVKNHPHKKPIDDKAIVLSKDYNIKVRMHCWGSTIYSPLNVKGIIKKNKDVLIFRPTEYSCYIMPIIINKSEIKGVKKRFKHKLIVELNSGIKYRFITRNRAQLINDIISK